MADSGNKRTTRPELSAAAEAERLAAEKEAADDRVFALTHRVATLESRERDLNELIVGHRERIAALEAERGAFGRERERAKEELDAIRSRERELTSELMSARERVVAIETERTALGETLESERRRSARLEERENELDRQLAEARDRIAALEGNGGRAKVDVEHVEQRLAALRERESELIGQLDGHRERIAALEAEREVLVSDLEDSRRESAGLRERTVTLHEQVARLEVEGEILNRVLREERAAHSALQQQGATLRPQLESARERIRALETEHDELREGSEQREQALQSKLEAIQEQLGRVEAHRETLERALTKEQGRRAKLKEQEAELAGTRQRIAALEAERDGLASELENERRSLAEVRERASELQRDLAEASARESDLQGTINGLREQATVVEAQRTTLVAERNELVAERDRLTARLEQLESSRTYRMMQFTWRARKRIRHPFRRTGRPVLTRTTKPAKRKKPAELDKPSEAPSPAPASGRPKVKPMPAPAMRKPSRPATATDAKTEMAEPSAPAKTPEPEKAAELTAPEPEKAPVPAPQPAVVLDELDAERERWLAKAQTPPADVSKLRVAGVLDEMSAACFEPDCDLLRIDSEGWAEALETHEPHLLLIESAWQGNNGSWQYMVASYTHPDYIGLPNLKALIAACRERDIPTVFWNKEDPVHFERFKEAAAHFDYVFTSDSNCIDRYAALEREGTGPISALQFAAQPLIHNPIGAPAGRNPSPVFAGAYYRDRHIDRQASLQMLLDAAMPFGLQIYDRRFGSEDKAFGFPERFTERVQGALAYDEMIDAYKDHKVFLNVNSVADSPTMFSRRVFELLACGTAVVSTESVGVQRTLGDVVSMIDTPKEATDSLTKLQDDDYWRELTQRGRRRVLGEHTYRHRLVELASTLGFSVTAYPGEEVAALALVDDVEQARNFRAVAASISAQETRPAELLIGSHTSVVGDLQELQSEGSEIRVRVVQQDPEASRSQRYRELAALAASPWLAILHPAHTYGEHHLTDLVLTTRFADADVIGNASFETTEGTDAIDRSHEHRFVDSVHPHSVLVKRELVARRGWPDDVGGAGGSLSEWFRHGVRIYSGDAGNFLADAALGLPGRAAATGSDRAPDG